MFWKKKNLTETYSQYGIPGHLFIQRDLRLKIVIDPPKDYFSGPLKRDKRSFDKLLLIHGCETPDINNIKEEVLSHASHFTKVLSFDKEVVATCKNAEPFVFGSCWVLTDQKGDLVNLRKDYHAGFGMDKDFELSFIKSNKKELPGHKLRQEIQALLKKDRPFKFNFPKERIETKVQLFKNAMFHLTIENSRYDNYITEKVIDCFMSYTIPIYWGCPNIGEHFDRNGIIEFNSEGELDTILSSLSPDLYRQKIEAIKKNYEIAKDNYAFFFDRINDVIREL